MNTIVKPFTTTFPGGQSVGATEAIASLNVPSGYYKAEVYCQVGAWASISIDQASLYYQYYNTNLTPVIFAIVEPVSGVLSFTLTAEYTGAITATGVIVITPIDVV
jgi:hypothetical protein